MTRRLQWLQQYTEDIQSFLGVLNNRVLKYTKKKLRNRELKGETEIL